MVKLYNKKGEQIAKLVVYKDRFVDINGNITLINRYRVSDAKHDLINKSIEEKQIK